ncbi:MAG: hypothetical protein E7578_01020 [Ruminococcaceae bacterium]|nr:hypothetical protein [Oscillospiraceae bacterium]
MNNGNFAHDLTEEELSGARAVAKKFNKRDNILKFVLIGMIVAIIVLHNVDVESYNYKTVPIEYSPMAEESNTGDYCYVDTIGAFEMFEMEEVIYRDGYKISSTGIKTTYYLAYDTDGFICLLSIDGYGKSSLDSMLASDTENMRFYGTKTSAPEDFNMDEISYYLDNIESENMAENAADSMSEDRKTIKKLFDQYDILSVKINPLTEKTVRDGHTIAYTLLSYLKIAILISIVGILVAKSILKKKCVADIQSEIAKVRIKKASENVTEQNQ